MIIAMSPGNYYTKRILDLKAILKNKSCFLFGPRQTGKTFLIKNNLPKYRRYDLLDTEVFLKLSQYPKILEEEIQAKDKIIIIDEIQLLPSLLNEVHRLIEDYNINFLLTGSSARNLRKKGVNLLGGRARSRSLLPFIYIELQKKFDFKKALTIGLIPSIYFSDAPFEDLKSYTGNYLKEEIIAEGATRNVPSFTRFLEIAALSNGSIINYTKIANDSQVARTTVQEYFQILKDTLIAYEVPAFKQKISRKTISTAKYYFFDIGVARFLQHQRDLVEKSIDFGRAFEAYIAHELKAYTEYNQLEPLTYWRSVLGHEVDFILDNKIAIEVKAKKNISKQELKGLFQLKKEKILKKHIVITLDNASRNIEGIEILPWQTFLDNLWNNKILK